MSEHEDKIDVESASAIIVSTCQLLPKSFSVVSDHMHNLVASREPTPKVYSILCGSFAEFYIRPLNPCISDIDFLICEGDHLAFTSDLPVLPTDMSGLSDTIICSKIESCQDYPGFVWLQFIGVMYYNWKYKIYEFAHTGLQNGYSSFTLNTSGTWFFSKTPSNSTSQSTVSGPAVQIKQDDS